MLKYRDKFKEAFMKLVEGQVELINNQVEKLKKEIAALVESKQISKAEIGINQALSHNYAIVNEISEKVNEKKDLENILKNAEIVQNPNTSSVEIGSVFTAFVQFSEDDCDVIHATLIEDTVYGERSEKYITIKSDLGKAIHHKDEGALFWYELESGEIAKGTITEIEYSNTKAPEKPVVKEKK